jgi:hypothetical protein
MTNLALNLVEAARMYPDKPAGRLRPPHATNMLPVCQQPNRDDRRWSAEPMLRPR